MFSLLEGYYLILSELNIKNCIEKCQQLLVTSAKSEGHCPKDNGPQLPYQTTTAKVP